MLPMKKQIPWLLSTLLAVAFSLSAAAMPRDRLHVVYVTNRDRDPRPDYKNRIHRIMADIRGFYRTEMERNGYGQKTFKLDPDKNRKVVVHQVILDWDFDPKHKFTPREMIPVINEHLQKEGIHMGQEYIVVFVNAYWEDDGVWKYDTPYTGGGDPIRGITWVVDHELLDPNNIIPGQTTHINDRGQWLTPGQFNVKMLGGSAHELGHALGLPHNKQSKKEFQELGTSLMGTGNYTYRQERLGGKKHGTFLTPAHTFILSLHPLFTGRVPTNFNVPDVFINDLEFKVTSNELILSGSVVPSSKVVGVVLYYDPMPTGLNKDYDAFSYVAKMNSYGKFTRSIPLLNADECALHLKVYFKNGMFTSFSFNQEKDHKVESLQQSYQRERVKYAFRKRDSRALKKLTKSLEENDTKALEVAQRFLSVAEPWQEFKIPAELSMGKKEISLSSSRWKSASIGWGLPCYNGIMEPDGQWLRPLLSKERRCPQGIFAHAPSNYTYDLGKRWKTFKGHIGLQRGQTFGSVVFIIKGDGKELFRSPLITLADGEVPVEINISRVKKLELITSSGPDGKGNDWGIWIAPTLLR